MDARRRWWGLAVLALFALALRVGLTLALARGDGQRTYEHGEIAANLLAGRGFTVTFLGQEGPTSQQAPLYPALLAGVYAVSGVGTSQSILGMQLLQCLAGTALVLCVVWLCWSIVPDRPAAGWCAGVGAAVYPPHVYMVTHIQVAVWAALALALLTAVVVAPRLGRSLSGAVLAGLLGGLLLLIEPILALALPILTLAMLVRNWPTNAGTTVRPKFPISDSQSTAAGLRAALAGPAVFTLITTLVVAPWIVRNYRVHGEFVFIKSTFGYAFWQGNNAASWGTDKVPKQTAEAMRQAHDGSLADIDRALWQARHETLYIDDVLLKPGGYQEFAGLTEPARCRLLGDRAWTFIARNPGRYLRLCGQRLRYFLLWDETNPKAAHPVYRAATSLWLVLVVAGVWIGRRRWRAWWPLAAICAAVALFHTLTITSARFRIPLEPLTFVGAGLAVTAILGYLGCIGATRGVSATRAAPLDADGPHEGATPRPAAERARSPQPTAAR